VRDALQKMKADRGRSALIMQGDRLVGIFTERDVLRRVAGEPETLEGPVDAVMTREPVVVSPDTSAADALRLMDEHHFRNLPVIDENGQVLGTMNYAS